MSNKTIDVSGLEAAFGSIVKDFERDVQTTSAKDIKAAAKVTQAELREDSPRSEGEGGGKYARGWKTTLESDVLGSTTAVIHNTTKPSLTHLLEMGHGGPHPAPAYPHIEPAFLQGKKELERRINAT